MQQKHIIDNFTEACLADIFSKLQMLPDLQQEAILRLHAQAESRIQSLSRIFLDLEDLVVRLLRQKIKLLFSQEEQAIAQQLRNCQTEIQTKVKDKAEELRAMQEKIDFQQAEGKKLLGKFAQGKVETKFESFKQEILTTVQLSSKQISYSQEEVEDLVCDIIDLLNIKHRHQQQPSETPQIFSSHSRISNYSKKTSKSLIGMKNNESIVSQVISQAASEQEINQSPMHRNRSNLTHFGYAGDSAILEHKQTKTIKKRQKMQQQLKKAEKLETKTINTIAELALEKKKLLQELE